MTSTVLLGVVLLSCSFGISLAAVFGPSLPLALALTVTGALLVLVTRPRR